MKVTAYEPTKKPEPVVRLKLVDEGRRVCVIAVDENGSRLPAGYLLSFEGGRVVFHGSVNKDFGFCLDDEGEIEVAE